MSERYAAPDVSKAIEALTIVANEWERRYNELLAASIEAGAIDEEHAAWVGVFGERANVLLQRHSEEVTSLTKAGPGFFQISGRADATSE